MLKINDLKFSNPYIKRCLNVLNNNNVKFDLKSIEIKETKYYDCIKKVDKISKRNIYTIELKNGIYPYKATASGEFGLYELLKRVIDDNRLYEQTFIK